MIDTCPRRQPRQPRRSPPRSRTATSLAGACVVVASALVGGCDDGATLGRFTVDEDIPETRVAGGGLATTLLPGAFAPIQLDVESEEEFGSQEFSVVNSITVRRITLDIAGSSEDAETDRSENGMPDDFDFLSSLEVFIEAEIDGETRRVSLARLAEGDPQLEGGNRQLTLDTTGENILPFVEADGGYVLSSTASGSPPPDDVVFEGSVAYRVSVGFR